MIPAGASSSPPSHGASAGRTVNPTVAGSVYYQDDYVTLYHGDCLQASQWLDADVLVTDPPYGIGYTRSAIPAYNAPGHRGITGDNDTATRDAALTHWGKDRAAFIFGAFLLPPANAKQVLVYQKPPDAGFNGAIGPFRRDIEAVYMLGNFGAQVGTLSSVLRTNRARNGGPSRGHPHSKPVDLMLQLLDVVPGTIADPFAGSGSTLVAAKLLGRRAIGVEIEERYCEIAANRLAQEVLVHPA